MNSRDLFVGKRIFEMLEPQWQKQRATLNHLNACNEFGFTENEVIATMNAGKLQYLRYL
jgi:hypothetical protein